MPSKPQTNLYVSQGLITAIAGVAFPSSGSPLTGASFTTAMTGSSSILANLDVFTSGAKSNQTLNTFGLAFVAYVSGVLYAVGGPTTSSTATSTLTASTALGSTTAITFTSGSTSYNVICKIGSSDTKVDAYVVSGYRVWVIVILIIILGALFIWFVYRMLADHKEAEKTASIQLPLT